MPATNDRASIYVSDEYAPLYRKSRIQQDWAVLQRNITS
jgi:hypothetical protein